MPAHRASTPAACCIWRRGTTKFDTRIWIAVLIERGRPYLDQPLLGTRLRWAHLDDLALDSQFVSRAYRVRPAKFIEACTDNASCGLKLALNQEPHGERRRVPAAGR